MKWIDSDCIPIFLERDYSEYVASTYALFNLPWCVSCSEAYSFETLWVALVYKGRTFFPYFIIVIILHVYKTKIV